MFYVSYISYLENVENSSNLSDEGKTHLKSFESERYNNEIQLCKISQYVYRKLCEIGVTKIDLLIPDGGGEVLFTPICTETPLKILKKHVGQKRYSKKVSAVKLKKKMKRLHKSMYDINEITGIRISSLEKYTSKDCTISILNISLIASVLKCEIEELVE